MAKLECSISAGPYMTRLEVEGSDMGSVLITTRGGDGHGNKREEHMSVSLGDLPKLVSLLRAYLEVAS